MSALHENWRILLKMFPADWEELGRRTGAVKRLRGFASLEALLRTLLLHVGCGWSLRETAVQAKLGGIADVCDVTLLTRLRQSETWLRQMCQSLWTENGLGLEAAVKGMPVRLIDATLVREPGPTGANWPQGTPVIRPMRDTSKPSNGNPGWAGYFTVPTEHSAREPFWRQSDKSQGFGDGVPK